MGTEDCVKHGFGVGKTKVLAEQRGDFGVDAIFFLGILVSAMDGAVQELHVAVEC